MCGTVEEGDALMERGVKGPPDLPGEQAACVCGPAATGSFTAIVVTLGDMSVLGLTGNRGLERYYSGGSQETENRRDGNGQHSENICCIHFQYSIFNIAESNVLIS